MFAKLVIAFAASVAVGTSSLAGDPSSVVDYFRKSGRDASFSGRKQEFAKLFPGETYRGTASQNERLLGVSRFGDEMTLRGEDSMGVFQQPSTNRTEVDFSREFAGWAPKNCQAIHQPTENELMSDIDGIAKLAGSCCGANELCDHLDDGCYSFLTPQNRACAVHDRRLAKECRKPWSNFGDPCVRAVHRELADSSTNPLIYVPFESISSTTETFFDVGESPALPAGFDWAEMSDSK